MKLVDMKLPKRTEKELKAEIPCTKDEGDRWPYGLKLSFDAEQVNKLPSLKNLEIGEKVSVSGIGEVTSIRMNERKGGKDEYSIEIQIQRVGIEGNEKKESLGDAIGRFQKSSEV